MAVGSNALGGLGSPTDGNFNVAIGNNTMSKLGTGVGSASANVALGASCGIALLAGLNNVLIGQGALGGGSGTLAGGNNNIFIGFNAGTNLTTGVNQFMSIGGWSLSNVATVGRVSQIIALSFGASSGGGSCNYPLLDFGFSATNTWSFNSDLDDHGNPIGIHVYKTQDAAPPTNYERAILDWNATANIFRIGSQAGGTGTVRLIAIDGFQKAGAPAAGDLPSGTCALINDTSGGQTWLCYNAAGTIRKVQLT
jgi:hypothetical protein